MINPFLFFIDRWWVTIPNVLNSNLSSVDAYQCKSDKLFFLFYFLLFHAIDNEGIDSLLTNINFCIVYVESNVCWILFSDVVITFILMFILILRVLLAALTQQAHLRRR